MKQNILINKIIFSPNLKPGQVMQIETEDEKATVFYMKIKKIISLLSL